MNIVNLYRVCPICDNNKGEVLHEQSFILPTNSPLPVRYKIVFCKQCGFVYADTPASQKTYNEYYKLLSKYEDITTATGGGINPFDQERLLATAEVIQRFVPGHETRILDLGCANGGLLKIFKSLGYLDISGIDPSKACNLHVQSAGIKCIEGDIFSDSFQTLAETFDCIVLTHVMEHICDLKQAVENISDKLADNGILYIEVPDASRYADYFTVPYYYIDCEHINHFETNSLSNLFTLNGFKQLESNNIELEVSSSQKYPACYSVFQKTMPGYQKNYHFSDSAKKSFIQFLEDSKNHDAHNIIIDQLVQSNEPIVIWGAGQFTLRLLANSSLGKCNIQGFIDSDSNKQGKQISAITIHPPEFLKRNEYAVVICSALHYEEIIKTINLFEPTRSVYILK